MTHAARRPSASSTTTRARVLRSVSAIVGISAVAAAAAVACGDASDDAGARPPSTRNDAGPSDASAGAPPVGSASGVVLLHAASFPAFRLCFENYPELRPQPDQAVMPQANVVGVEVGSVVRIGPLERPPGKVYAIIQSEARASPTDPGGKACGALIAEDLTLNLQYHEAGELTAPLGVGEVTLLGLTGCGGKPISDKLGVDADDCGPDWDIVAGSLRARTLTLLPTVAATPSSLPVQIVHMSSLLEAARANGEELDVTFGLLLDAGVGERLEQDVAISPPLFDASAATTLAVDQTTETTYGTHGFRIGLRSDGGAPSFTFDQSLAEVQDLSSPQTVPTTYYLAASNYALLLLGDPRIRRTLADGGPNAGWDPRRAVHLLAVPVKEEADAGEPSAGEDGGSTVSEP